MTWINKYNGLINIMELVIKIVRLFINWDYYYYNKKLLNNIKLYFKKRKWIF
jgi:hypothetical protein